MFVFFMCVVCCFRVAQTSIKVTKIIIFVDKFAPLRKKEYFYSRKNSFSYG